MTSQIKTFFENFKITIGNKSNFQKFLILSWVFMPFLMMISRSIVDILITLIASTFIINSITERSWSWVNINWLKYGMIFFLILIFSSSFSENTMESLLNGITWIRFPLFAAAISLFLIKDREVLFFTIFSNFLSIILVFILMGAESILTDHWFFEWPFGNPLNGPFIHRIGIIFFALAFLVLFSEINYKVTAIIFILLSIFFSLLTGHRVGNFSFIIMIAICCFWPKLYIKKAFMIIISFCIILALYFSYNVDKLDRYFFDILNLTNSSLLQYMGQWKTGIKVFFDNFIIGIGPTNIQNYLELGIIQNFDPYKNYEHPHNHFIQAFAETGFIGGVIYCLIIYNLIKEIYISTKKNLSPFTLLISQAAFISSICLLWPFANTYDLFGQQQNAFLWYCISIYLVITKSKDLKNNFPQN